MFDYLFYTSLAVFLLGLIYKISTWFTRKIGIVGKRITAPQRLLAVVKGITGVIFSSKIFALLEAVVLDVFLQRRILKESVSRWLAHMLIFYGFTLLLLMHALESLISEAIFNEYYSTINPFFFLRDFLGSMVLTGV
ncbi:MAG: hypothetical protein PVG40_14060, partial [Desulfobacterales bacterium]